MENKVDVLVENHGSIFLLRPVSPAGQSWLSEHTDPSALTFGEATVVEPRYVGDIVHGAIEDGLVVE